MQGNERSTRTPDDDYFNKKYTQVQKKKEKETDFGWPSLTIACWFGRLRARGRSRLGLNNVAKKKTRFK